jgi:DNA modification methylase
MGLAPFFENAYGTIYLGDCREIMCQLPPGSVDLLVTDPPYGVNYQSNYRSEGFERIQGDDGKLNVEAAMALACRVLRHGGHIYVFGPARLFHCPVSVTAELIWDKGNRGLGDLAQPWGTQHERILFAASVMSKAERDQNRYGLAARLRRGSVLRVNRKHGQAVQNHPTEKPTELLRQLIEASSSMGDIVFDPFLGSGSTLVAAAMEGRQGIGIEIVEKYAAIAARRLELVRPASETEVLS